MNAMHVAVNNSKFNTTSSLSKAADELVEAQVMSKSNGSRLERELLRKGKDGHFLGGLVHEEMKDSNGRSLGNVVHIANPYQAAPLNIITLPTRCTKEEIEKIKAKIIPMRETYEVLAELATAYEHREPILIEGDTSIGKTFIVNRFMEILYGLGARPIDFFCSGQTDVSELLGKWAPKASNLNSKENELIEQFIGTDFGQKKVAAIQTELKEAAMLPQEMQTNLTKHKLSQLVEELGIGKSMQWEFAYGAVPKAMTCNVEAGGKITLSSLEGAGTILKIDEVGLAEPAVIMALLRVRGEAGKLSKSIQLWEAGGQVVNSGPDFFVVFTTNPSDKDYLERKEIDPALARSVVWIRKGALSAESLTLAAQKFLSFSVGNYPEVKPLRSIIDLRSSAEISSELAEITALVHARYLELIKSGEAGRRQKLPGSLDHLARMASYLLCNQVVDSTSGKVDFAETFKRAVRFVYLAGLSDEKLIGVIEKEVDMLLGSDSIGVKKFKGKDQKRNEILTELVKEAQPDKHNRKPKNSISQVTQERQIYFDVMDALLAQLGETEVSLTGDLIPQIVNALEMLQSSELKGEFVAELLSKDRPNSRLEKDWKEYKKKLEKISEDLAASDVAAEASA